VRYPSSFKAGSALAAWILALLLVAGTFAAGHPQAQDRPPAGDPSTLWRA